MLGGKKIKSEKVLIVGGGNMGIAYATALLRNKICSPNKLTIVEIDSRKRRILRRQLGAHVLPQLPTHVTKETIVILAIKPQDMKTVCQELGYKLHPRSLVLSVMAGIKISSIDKLIMKAGEVVRCMPNLPAKIGLGITVAHIPRSTTAYNRRRARLILGSTGALVEVSREMLLNQATAVSGSGPAYLYYFAEQLIAVAVELGFTPLQAEQLVSDTIIGAASLWRLSGESPGKLRERVTSKNGTTHAALGVFEGGRLGETLRKGVRAASKRAEELARHAAKSG